MNTGGYVWLDAPFFKFLERFEQIRSYFTGITWDIARVVVILCLGFLFLKHAMTGEGLKENLTKFLLSFVIYSVIIANYPKIITGINDLIYEFSVNSTYLAGGEEVDTLQEYAEKVRMKQEEAAAAAMEGRAEAEAAQSPYGTYAYAYMSNLAKEKETKKESIDISGLIEKEIFDEKTKYIKPNAMVKLIMMICGEIWSSSPRNIATIGQTLLDLLCMAAVILCGVFGSAQYFIGALEFSLVTAVGIIFMPFMLWDGTKFITEKFIGALLGFFLKMLFLTMCILFTYYGFLEMTLRPYSGMMDQIIYFIFSAVFYMMITQNGPKLAVTLLTGTPQMSVMEAAEAAGAYGGAAILGKKAVGAAAGAAARGGFAARGAHERAKGSADFAKSEGATKKEQAAAYRSSAAASIKEGVAARASTMGRSLLSGGSGGGFFGGGRGGGGSGGAAKGYNRFSQLERFNQADEKGRNITMKEHLGKQYNTGQEDGLNYMIQKEERAQRMNPPRQGRSLGGGAEQEGANDGGGDK
jgi:type IV secretion system protein TrbL